MKYLTVAQILLIHSMAIDETGGSHGVRDYHALVVLEDLPKQKAFGHELYPTVFDKSAVYARNIASARPFVDGNKRTAMTAAAVFLADNGYLVTAKEGEVERFALRIVRERLPLPIIAAWFKRRTRRVRG